MNSPRKTNPLSHLGGDRSHEDIPEANASTDGHYTVLTTDDCREIHYTNTSAITINLPAIPGKHLNSNPGTLFLVPPESLSDLPTENPDSNYYQRLCATLDAVFGLDTN